MHTSDVTGIIQSTVLDSIRMSILSNSRNGSGGGIIETLLLSAVISLFVYLSKTQRFSFSFIDCIETYKSLLYKKCAVRLEGSTTISSSFYKTSMTCMYSDNFKAMWSFINKMLNTNQSVREIREIPNTIRIKHDDMICDKYTGLFVVSQKEHFLLDSTLELYAYATDSSSDHDEKAGRRTYKYELYIYSYKSNTAQIDEYIKKITASYLAEIEHSRENKRFMYSLTSNKYENNALECWRESEFSSSKRFDNIFFENKTAVLDKIDFFINNREWYNKFGIPYTLGIGLYGPPGTGKTSFVKALMNYVGDRHLCSMPMAVIRTKKQLIDFYYESQFNDNNKVNSIGFDKKIIVIEDIDCAGDIVLERSPAAKLKEDSTGVEYTEIINKLSVGEKTTITDDMRSEIQKIIHTTTQKDDPITLDDILNLWDGIIETPGRILVISSNRYDQLDAAIRRPGRIDITLEMGNSTHNMIRDMFFHFYGEVVDESILKRIIPLFYSPAEIVNVYTTFRTDPAGFMERLVQNKKIM